MRYQVGSSAWAVAASLLCGSALVDAQTFSNCNPLTSGSCPADPALGKAETFDFTQGSSDQFTNQGNPTFDSNGASFTIAKSGDSPQITSKFYIMFGKVEVEMKAAPGKGIVSSSVLQSDDLDEIDWEWLGADGTQVQSNYFGKGQTTTYNRGAFHAAPGNQDSFKTYTIDWTADQISWQLDGTTVRTLSQQDASGQYPQTPMQVKIGAWSAGDPSNAPGTVQWAQGPTVYSAGPFTMQVKSVKVTDYSTGTQYKYNGQAGTWESIDAVGGKVNPSGSGGDSAPATATAAAAPTITSASPSMPYPFEGTHRDTTSTYTTPNVYPWVANPTTLHTTSATQTSYPGLPAGWSVSSSGKVIPPSSAPTSSLPRSSSYASPSPSPSAAGAAEGGAKVVTSFNEQGFATLVTIQPGASNAPKHYNDQGFLITSAPASPAPTRGSDSGSNGGSGDGSGSLAAKSIGDAAQPQTDASSSDGASDAGAKLSNAAPTKKDLSNAAVASVRGSGYLVWGATLAAAVVGMLSL